MLTRVLSAGLLAGLVAGLAIAILQHFTTTPLILEAEAFENAPAHHHAADAGTLVRTSAMAGGLPLIRVHGDAPTSAQPDAPAGSAGAASVWAPADGIERTAWTSAATIAAAIGFAFLMIGGMLASGDTINDRNALAWAAAGFVVTGLAPAAGIAPELPGMPASDLLERQSWWLITSAATALGLWLFLRRQDLGTRVLAVLLLLAPHIMGAPHLTGAESSIPADLAARFAGLSLVVHAALWMATGLAVSVVWPRVVIAGEPRPAV